MHAFNSELLKAVRREKARRLSATDRQELRTNLLGSHLRFMQHFFEEKEGSPFLVAPYHPVMCETLDRVYTGEIKRLIITIPPGYFKTETAVINFIAHGLALNPRARFIHASYADVLALDNSAKVKDLIALEGFQALWPITLRADTKAKGLWRTYEGGGLRAAASGMPITGFRAGRIGETEFNGALVIDDPLKPDDANSDKERKFINERWENTFKSRLADENVPVIVIMQRLHVDDFVAHVTKNSGERWHMLRLPVLVEENDDDAPEGNVELIPHNLPYGPLWEKKHTLPQIEVLKLAPQVYFGQYKQRPVVRGGNLFKIEGFGRYRELPNMVWRGIYADTAQKLKERNDYTVFEHWGKTEDGKSVLIDVVRGRFEAPALEEMAVTLWTAYRFLDQRFGALRKMVIEDKSSGTGLIQGLAKKAIPVVALQRDRDKYTRALDVLIPCASGLVMLPMEAPWLTEFEAEVASFPDGVHDDQVDPLIDATMDMHGNLGVSYDNL